MPLFGAAVGGPPLPSLTTVDGGMYVPRRALDRWSIPTTGLAHICCVGDSMTQATDVLGSKQGNSYLDGFVQRLQRACGTAFGGLRGAGYFGLWRSGNTLGYLNTAADWAVAGTWTQVGVTTGPNLIPFNGIFQANGAANILTFTPPSAVASRAVNDATTFGSSFTVAASSAGVNTNSFAGAGTLNVNESTAAAPAAGAIVVRQGVLVSVLTYTGKGANSFTGCTFVPSQAIVMATNDTVTNNLVVSSATAAFSATTDIGQTIYGPGIFRNACVLNVASATLAIMSQPPLTVGTNLVLGLEGRNLVPGGIAAFDVVWVDGPVSGTFSISTDGGATWPTQVASTHPANATLKRATVVAANPANIKIRAANTAGTGALTFQCGIILYSQANPTSGVMVHSFACDGKTYNPTTVGGASGLLSQGSADQLRIFDNQGDATQTGSLQPSLMIFMFINDMVMVDTAVLTLAQYSANIQTLITRFYGYCDLLFVNPPEANAGLISTATQAACRSAVRTVCTANNVAVLDLYDAWAAQGETGYTTAYADGLIFDQIHPSLEGHADIAGHVLRLLAIAAV